MTDEPVSRSVCDGNVSDVSVTGTQSPEHSTQEKFNGTDPIITAAPMVNDVGTPRTRQRTCSADESIHPVVFTLYKRNSEDAPSLPNNNAFRAPTANAAKPPRPPFSSPKPLTRRNNSNPGNNRSWSPFDKISAAPEVRERQRNASEPKSLPSRLNGALTRSLSLRLRGSAANADSAPPQSKKVQRYYRRQSDLVQSCKADSIHLEKCEKFDLVPRRLSIEATPPKIADGTAEVRDDTKRLPVDTEAQLVTASDNAETPSADPFKLQRKTAKRASLLAKITLIVNVILLLIKAVASFLSGSLSIISSLVDSVVDITSGLTIWLTSRAIKNRDPYLYPRGRTRLEPLALIIVSVVMAVASIQLIIHSTQAIINGDIHPVVEWPTILIMVATILIKFILMLVCMRYGDNPNTKVLAQDHRNDCISNTVAIVCAFAADKWWVYLDPIGAIVVSVYIAATWFSTGYDQVAILSGRSAPPDFINRILRICLNHDVRIEQIDTLYVYHFGTNFLVEVDIVLDGDMRLRDAHDISEPLQRKLEHLPFVERAFVHTDYETEHRPEDEHKLV